jgi:anti-sigma factor RsiW
MKCESAKNLIEPYLDDELDAASSVGLQEHLTTCESCSETHARYLGLRGDIRMKGLYYEAPAGLRDRIQGALRQASRSESRESRPGRVRPWRWIAVAASILLAVSLAWNLALLRSRPASSDLLTQNVLSSHVRSLIGDHLLDVPSSDQHRVKPWFNGKVDFSPNVKDFTAQGFPLVGGRIDYLANRPVAALVYRRRQHVINLFTWPSDAAGGEAEPARNGYNVVHWSKGGMTYWAVSDLGIGELQQFENLYQ